MNCELTLKSAQSNFPDLPFADDIQCAETADAVPTSTIAAASKWPDLAEAD
jgi:hypothetical protein